MGMFFSDGDKISRSELDKALTKLRYDHNFPHSETSRLKEIFRGDMHESGNSAGISKEELRKAISWLKSHKNEHHFSSNQIETIEKVLSRYL